MTAPGAEGQVAFITEGRASDNFQKLSNFFDLQQVAPWWLSGLGSASVREKTCMRIFCKKAQVQIQLKFIVELLVL